MTQLGRPHPCPRAASQDTRADAGAGKVGWPPRDPQPRPRAPRHAQGGRTRVTHVGDRVTGCTAHLPRSPTPCVTDPAGMPVQLCGRVPGTGLQAAPHPPSPGAGSLGPDLGPSPTPALTWARCCPPPALLPLGALPEPRRPTAHASGTRTSTRRSRLPGRRPAGDTWQRGPGPSAASIAPRPVVEATAGGLVVIHLRDGGRETEMERQRGKDTETERDRDGEGETGRETEMERDR